jgi:hypothetical protein
MTAAGFEIRGNRATCPYCVGSRKLTVAIHGDLYFCHRCARGGCARSLARKQGICLPQPRVGKSAIQKERFKQWLATKMTEIAKEENKLVRQWRYAIAALEFFREMDQSWQVLANYYHRRRFFEQFWECANDNVGRYWLYRSWRRHVGR